MAARCFSFYRCWRKTVWDASNLRRTVQYWSSLQVGRSPALVTTVVTTKIWGGTRWSTHTNRIVHFTTETSKSQQKLRRVLSYRVKKLCLSSVEPPVKRTGCYICAKSVLLMLVYISVTDKLSSKESYGLSGELLTSQSYVSVVQLVVCQNILCTFSAQIKILLTLGVA